MQLDISMEMGAMVHAALQTPLCTRANDFALELVNSSIWAAGSPESPMVDPRQDFVAPKPARESLGEGGRKFQQGEILVEVFSASGFGFALFSEAKVVSSPL